MSVSNQTNKTYGSGDGSTVTFSFLFKIFDVSELVVYKVSAAGVATLQVYTTDYTATINSITEGGTVTFVVAPASGTTWFIKRVVPYTQSAAIPTEGVLPAAQIENQLDLMTMMIVQVNETVGRALTLPVTFTGSIPSLPSAQDGYVIGWDGNGGALKNYLSVDAATLNAAVASAQSAASTATSASNSAQSNAAAASASAAAAAASAAQAASGLNRVSKTTLSGVTNSGNLTFDATKFIKIIFKFNNLSGAGRIAVRINNDTGNNYYYSVNGYTFAGVGVQEAGAAVNSLHISPSVNSGADNVLCGELIISPKSPAGYIYLAGTGVANGCGAFSFGGIWASSPASTIRFFNVNGDTMDGEIDIFSYITS